MTSEMHLADKLRKIEALFAGAATSGEKQAAGAAAERIRLQLGVAKQQEPAIEFKVSLPDPWSRKLFGALCRRYGLRPFRYARMQQQTVLVRAPRSFVERTLWPEFTEINKALSAYLGEITDKVIHDEVHDEAGEADEVAEPRALAR